MKPKQPPYLFKDDAGRVDWPVVAFWFAAGVGLAMFWSFAIHFMAGLFS